jgi:hypothetical protein
MNAIKLLNNEANLTYAGSRIKWTGDLNLLKNYVENVIGLTGTWKSLGGNAKPFKSSTFDFTLTWYPGKQNSILLHGKPGKDGELFKQILVTVLDTDHVVRQADAILDSLSVNTADPQGTNNGASAPKLLQTSVKDFASQTIHETLQCKNCGNLRAEVSELAERLNCLFDLTHKIYNLLNKSLTTDPLPNSGQSLINKKDTNSGYCDLSADLEGVKLDVVIIESRFSNSISANQNEIGKIDKEINHFRDQLFILQKEQQKTSKEITNHDAVINELSSQACSSQDIALEYNYQSGNASNYDAGNEENESGISMVANVESSQEENANLNASMQSNKSSEREISIVLSKDVIISALMLLLSL